MFSRNLTEYVIKYQTINSLGRLCILLVYSFLCTYSRAENLDKWELALLANSIAQKNLKLFATQNQLPFSAPADVYAAWKELQTSKTGLGVQVRGRMNRMIENAKKDLNDYGFSTEGEKLNSIQSHFLIASIMDIGVAEVNSGSLVRKRFVGSSQNEVEPFKKAEKTQVEQTPYEQYIAYQNEVRSFRPEERTDEMLGKLDALAKLIYETSKIAITSQEVNEKGSKLQEYTITPDKSGASLNRLAASLDRKGIRVVHAPGVLGKKGALGMYNSKTNTFYISDNTLISSKLMETGIHEMVHAYIDSVRTEGLDSLFSGRIKKIVDDAAPYIYKDWFSLEELHTWNGDIRLLARSLHDSVDKKSPDASTFRFRINRKAFGLEHLLLQTAGVTKKLLKNRELIPEKDFTFSGIENKKGEITGFTVRTTLDNHELSLQFIGTEYKSLWENPERKNMELVDTYFKRVNALNKFAGHLYTDTHEIVKLTRNPVLAPQAEQILKLSTGIKNSSNRFTSFGKGQRSCDELLPSLSSVHKP